jgi:hypothetical protein
MTEATTCLTCAAAMVKTTWRNPAKARHGSRHLQSIIERAESLKESLVYVAAFGRLKSSIRWTR